MEVREDQLHTFGVTEEFYHLERRQNTINACKLRKLEEADGDKDSI